MPTRNWRISNIILACFMVFYVLASLTIYLQNLGSATSGETDSSNRRNKKSSPLVCDPRCCSDKEVDDSYRYNLHKFFQLLRENSSNLIENEELKLRSNCRILMDEDVILRTMKHGISHKNINGQRRQPKIINPTKDDSYTRNKNKTTNCKPLGYSSVNLPRTALASFPGSGNTWVRHLLQQATGVLTISSQIAANDSLEKAVVKNNSVLLIDTQENYIEHFELRNETWFSITNFSRVVILLRDPAETLLENFVLRGLGPLFDETEYGWTVSSAWNNYLKEFPQKWVWYYTSWLKFVTGKVYIIHYDALMRNFKNEFKDLLGFLDFSWNNELLDCVHKHVQETLHNNVVETYMNDGLFDKNIRLVLSIFEKVLERSNSGLYTGSMYGDGSLRKIFPGEGKKDTRVVVIKIHETNRINTGFFKRAIVIIRNPYDAIKSEYARLKGGEHHTYQASDDLFANKTWPSFVERNAWDWFYSTIRWLNFPGPLHILRYENLKANLRQEVENMMLFLNITIRDEVLDCVVENSEGSYRRKKTSTYDPYSHIPPETIDLLDTFIAGIETTIVIKHKRND